MTLARVLNQHPSITALHEPFPRLIELSGEAYKKPRSDIMKLIIRIARSDYINEFNRQGKLFVETANRLTFFAYAINKVFPNAKFIHLVRNPISVVKSGVRRGWYCGHPWDRGRIFPDFFSYKGRSWDELTPSEKVAWNWVETNNFIVNFLKNIPSEMKFFIQLERIHEKLPDIWSFLGLKNFDCDINKFNEGGRTDVDESFVPFLIDTGEDIITECGYSIQETSAHPNNVPNEEIFYRKSHERPSDLNVHLSGSN
jgi:hypothetical protein